MIIEEILFKRYFRSVIKEFYFFRIKKKLNFYYSEDKNYIYFIHYTIKYYNLYEFFFFIIFKK